ncbi:MAG TPA: TonB-dependent receptor plug domain-containing protein [Pseudobdellovibrionaceae bacterium]
MDNKEPMTFLRIRKYFSVKKSLIPFFALGMGVQIQNGQNSFLQTSPSSEEIASDILQEHREVSPSDSLKSLPGLVVLGSEVTTYTGSLFLRGANGDQTLVLWNDFRSDNFTGPSGATDPFGLGSEFSNRIRVLKGPQSLLYGTQAMGGVVLIENDSDVDSSIELAGGSLKTSRGLGEFRFRGEKWQLALGGSAFSTEGVSAYNASVARGTEGKLESDGRQKDSLSLIASMDFSAQDQLQIMVNGLQDSLNDDAPPQEDINAHSEARTKQWKIRYKTLWSERVGSSFLLTSQETKRENKNPADIYNPDEYMDTSYGQRISILNRNNIRWLKSLWQVGFEYNEEQGDFFSSTNSAFVNPQTFAFNPKTNDESVYLVNDWNFKSSDISWGLRENCRESKACLTVYQLAYQWHWVESQRSVYGLLSSGLKRPVLYQLYSRYGDPLLRAEHSQAYEVGMIQRWGLTQEFKLSVFDNHFSDLIDYDFITEKYKNLKRVKTQGVEIKHQYEGVTWDTQFSIAQIYAKDEDSGLYLLRRPVIQGAWSLGYQIFEPLHFMNQFIYVGSREDVDIASRVVLKEATLWNVALNYKSGVYGHYFLRINNLGNIFYEDIKGYLTPGRFVWLGTQLLF